MSSIDILKHARLGIDVDHYIFRLINKKEVFLDAVGGFPNTLRLYVQSDLKVFKELGITPVFVFSGLRNNALFELLQHDKLAANAASRQKVWELYYGKYDKPVTDSDSASLASLLFKTLYNLSNRTLDTSSYASDLVQMIHGLGLEYLVAPYSSWAQLSYMYSAGVVDMIYGPTECLLAADIDKFILGMEFQSREFRFIEKKTVLSELHLSHRQFKELAVTLGCDIQPYSLTANFANFPHDRDEFLWLHEFTLGGNSVYDVILANSKKTGSTVDLNRFKDGMSTLEYLPVMKVNGRVEVGMEPEGGFDPAGELQVPNDIHDFISQRLPHEYYFYQLIGLVDSKLLEVLAFGVYLELPPLDGGNTAQYLALVNSSSNFEIKNKTLNLLTGSMARYFQMKKIHYDKWFGQQAEFEFRLPKPLYFLLNGIVVRSDTAEFALAKFLPALEHISSGPVSEATRLKNANEVISTALARVLYLYGFVNSDRSLTEWGQILAKLDVSGLSNLQIESLLLVLIYFKNHSAQRLDGPLKVLGENKNTHVRAVTRLSLFHEALTAKSIFNLASLNKLNQNLLAFRSIFQFIKTQASELEQSVLLTLLCYNEFDRQQFNNKQWKDFVAEVPLKGNLPSTIMAIIADVYFDNWKGDLAQAKGFISKVYGYQLSEVVSELESNFKFVKKALELGEQLAQSNLIPEDYGKFLTSTREFLEERL